MPVNHYENFPVASFALPRKLREPVQLIYEFARTADDFADEGEFLPAQRLARLDDYRRELAKLAQKQTPATRLFADLQSVIEHHHLPLAYFDDLLNAFSQDVTKHRYQNFEEVLAYCRLSANPVGRLLLHLFGKGSDENMHYSDAICTSLQVINFLQDVAIDYKKNRIYLPQNEMTLFGIGEEHLARGRVDSAWQDFYAFQLNRIERLLISGTPLEKNLHGRIRLEIRLIIAAAHLMIKKLRANNGAVFQRRPLLTSLDWPRLLLHALR